MGGDLEIGSATAATQSVVSGANSVVLEGLNVRLAGGSAIGASSSVLSNGNISINTAGNFVIQGGSQQDTFAQIKAVGNVNAIVGGTLSVLGGSGSNAYALFDPTAAGALLTINAANGVNLQGGQGAGAYAAIASGGDVLINAPSLSLQAGSGADADAVVISNFGNVTAPAICTGCQNLTAMPLGDGQSGTGIFNGAMVIMEANPGGGIGSGVIDLTQIETVIEAVVRDPRDDERDPDGDIVVEGQTCP
jgi:hypothetical protein